MGQDRRDQEHSASVKRWVVMEICRKTPGSNNSSDEHCEVMQVNFIAPQLNRFSCTHKFLLWILSGDHIWPWEFGGRVLVKRIANGIQ